MVVRDMGTLYSWLKTGGKAVLHNVAEERAMTCAQCPLNGRKGLLSYFTRPAAALIREQLERKNDLRLWTSVDPILGTCLACKCVMSLKVHSPADVILKHLKPKTKAKLWSECWILKL